jgi:hypothetical protein
MTSINSTRRQQSFRLWTVDVSLIDNVPVACVDSSKDGRLLKFLYIVRAKTLLRLPLLLRVLDRSCDEFPGMLGVAGAGVWNTSKCKQCRSFFRTLAQAPESPRGVDSSKDESPNARGAVCSSTLGHRLLQVQFLENDSPECEGCGGFLGPKLPSKGQV